MNCYNNKTVSIKDDPPASINLNKPNITLKQHSF